MLRSSFLFSVLILFIFGGYSVSAGAPNPDELCENVEKIAKEYVELELAGVRWQGVSGIPRCLKDLKPAMVKINRTGAHDPALLDPEFLLVGTRSIALGIKSLSNDLVQVTMSYIGKKSKRDVPVKDQLVLKLNFGAARELKGCASLYAEPKHFVMREKCWKE